MILRPRIPPGARLPPILSSSNSSEFGGTVVFSELAARKTVVVITQATQIDAPGRELLKLLKWLSESREDNERRVFRDSLTKSRLNLPEELSGFISMLVSLDAHFVVLVPAWSPTDLDSFRDLGPESMDLVADPLPHQLPLGKLLGLTTAGGMSVWPAVLTVDADCEVKSVVIGRGNGWYGDAELVQELGRKRVEGVEEARVSWRQGERIRRGLERYNARFPPKYDHPDTDPLPVEILLHILEYLIPEGFVHRSSNKDSQKGPPVGLEKFLRDLSDRDDNWSSQLHKASLVSRSFLSCVLETISRHALPALNSLKESLPHHPDGKPAKPLDTALYPRNVSQGAEVDGVREYRPVEVPYPPDVAIPFIGLGEIEERRKKVERWRRGLERWEK